MSTVDLINEKPLRAILKFALPILAALIFGQLYGIVDTIIVRKILGVEALAAIGSTTSAIFFITGFTGGLTFGLTTYFEKLIGAKDLDNVKKSAAICISLSIISGMIISFLCVFFCKDILELLKVPDGIFYDAYSYLVIIYAGMVFYSLFYILINLIRGLGDSKITTHIQIILSVMNIFLDILAIIVLDLGVAGVALATVSCWIIGILWQIILIRKKFPLLHITLKDFKFEKEYVLEHLKDGLSMGFQASIISIGEIVRQIALNHLGDTPIASFAVTSKIEGLAMMPMIAFGIAIKTYVAQNYGAKRFDRIIKGVKQTCIVSIIFAIAIALFNIFFGEKIISMFISKYQIQIIEYAKTFFMITCSFYWALALLQILRAALQGMGKVLIPTLSSFIELFMRILIVLLLFDLLGYNGVCTADPAAWFGAFLINFIAFIFTVKKWNPKI